MTPHRHGHQRVVDRAGPLDVAGSYARDHRGERGRPTRCPTTLTTPAAPTREQRQVQGVVAGVVREVGGREHLLRSRTGRPWRPCWRRSAGARRAAAASRSRSATPVRPGMSYDITGSSVASATAREVREQPVLRRPVVVRRDDEQRRARRPSRRRGPARRCAGCRWCRRRRRRARGRRPPRGRRAATASFSASVVVGDSPVVPLTTSPSLPRSTRSAASAAAASTSSAPSRVNGVTIAVSTRPNGCRGVEVAAMASRLPVDPGCRPQPRRAPVPGHGAARDR